MSPSWRAVRGRPIPSPRWSGPEGPDRVRRSDLRGRDIAVATRSRLDPPALAVPAPFPQARSPFEAFPSSTARWSRQVSLSLRTRSPWPLPSRRYRGGRCRPSPPVPTEVGYRSEVRCVPHGRPQGLVPCPSPLPSPRLREASARCSLGLVCCSSKLAEGPTPEVRRPGRRVLGPPSPARPEGLAGRGGSTASPARPKVCRLAGGGDAAAAVPRDGPRRIRPGFRSIPPEGGLAASPPEGGWRCRTPEGAWRRVPTRRWLAVGFQIPLRGVAVSRPSVPEGSRGLEGWPRRRVPEGSRRC